MGDEQSTSLAGGRTTRDIVRVGNTVRRPTGPHTPFVHRVLKHLHEKGFAGAPSFEGIDDRGREMLAFIPGEVPLDLGFFSDAQLAAAARLLRRLHDASVDFASLKPGHVVCHGDASPCNHVFRDGMPIALIDFDAAYAGERRDDLGYAAWLWLDLGNPSIEARAQGRRLGLFFDEYGAPASDAIDAALDAQTALAARCPSRPPVRRWALACRRYVLGHATSIKSGLADHVTVEHLSVKTPYCS